MTDSEKLRAAFPEEALEHKFANVTKDYIRIDISRLKLVALEVPSHV